MERHFESRKDERWLLLCEELLLCGWFTFVAPLCCDHQRSDCAPCMQTSLEVDWYVRREDNHLNVSFVSSRYKLTLVK